VAGRAEVGDLKSLLRARPCRCPQDDSRRARRAQNTIPGTRPGMARGGTTSDEICQKWQRARSSMANKPTIKRELLRRQKQREQPAVSRRPIEETPARPVSEARPSKSAGAVNAASSRRLRPGRAASRQPGDRSAPAR
jgi:hypothetical protein